MQTNHLTLVPTMLGGASLNRNTKLRRLTERARTMKCHPCLATQHNHISAADQ